MAHHFTDTVLSFNSMDEDTPSPSSSYSSSSSSMSYSSSLNSSSSMSYSSSMNSPSNTSTSSPVIRLHKVPKSSDLYNRRASKRGASANGSRDRQSRGSRDRAEYALGHRGRYDNSSNNHGRRNQDTSHGGPDVLSVNIACGYTDYPLSHYHPPNNHQESFEPSSCNVSHANGQHSYPEVGRGPPVPEQKHHLIPEDGYISSDGSRQENSQQGNMYNYCHVRESDVRNYDVPDGAWCDTDQGISDCNLSPGNSESEVLESFDNATNHPLHPSLMSRLFSGDNTRDAINFSYALSSKFVCSQPTIDSDSDVDEEALQQGYRELRKKLPTLSESKQVEEYDLIMLAMERIDSLRQAVGETTPPDSDFEEGSVDMDGFQYGHCPPSC